MAAPKKSSPSGTDEVNAFMATLEHPHKAEIQALREILLAAHPTITEGIKWNAPSFRTTDYFATFHLRAKGCVQLILHFGAKVKDNTQGGVEIEDPAGLLEWLAKDRATVKFLDLEDVRAKESAFGEVVRQWIGWV